MHKKTLLSTAITFLALLATHTGFSQDTAAGKFPRALLVQLRSEHNRIEALTKDRKYADLEIVKKDGAEVITRMIADFRDNFNACPVYYYMDSNADLIKKRRFAGVLFNADSTPVTHPVISDTSTDYYIVFYGYPTTQPRNADSVTNQNKYTYDSGEPMGKGLIIYNHNYQQVSYLYKLDYQMGLFRMFKTKKNKQYAYESDRFDIEYFPFADVLNEMIIKRRMRIKNAPMLQTMRDNN